MKTYLSHYTRDEVRYYQVCFHKNFVTYLCLGAHVFYLLDETFRNAPERWNYSEIAKITLDKENKFTFSMTVVVFGVSSEIVIETLKRERVVEELQVAFKTDKIVKSWTCSMKEIPVETSSSIPNSRIPIPLDKTIEVPKGFVIHEFQDDNYYFLLDERLKLTQHDEKLPFHRYVFQNETEKLTVSILPPRLLVERMHLHLFTSHLSTDALIKKNIDYVVNRDEYPPKKSCFKEDFTVWDIENRTVETDNEIINFVVCRRIFLPPDAQKYQDVIFERRVDKFKGDATRDHLVEMVSSFGPIPQAFLFDILHIRSYLESLNGDEDYYTWAQNILGIKVELLPIKTQVVSNKYNRCDVFAKCVGRLIGLEDLAPHVTETVPDNIEDLFLIEQDLVDNCDSPDTILNPTEKHLAMRRFKLSKYLAHYCNGSFEPRLNLHYLVSLAPRYPVVHHIITYFLHVHKTGKPFSYHESLRTTVEFCEKSSEISMNYNFLIHLIQTDYFTSSKEVMAEHTLSKLICMAIRNIKDISLLVDLCKKIRGLDLESLSSYPPFLETLSLLLRSNESSILFAVCLMIADLSVTSKTIKQWICYNVPVINTHLLGGKAHSRLISLFCSLLINCVDSRENREVFVDSGTCGALVKCLVDVSKDSSPARVDMLEKITHLLWVLSPDEVVGPQLVEGNTVLQLLIILNESTSLPLHINIMGIFLILSSYDSLKQDLLKYEVTKVMMDVMARDSENDLFTKSDIFIKLVKNVFGAFLILTQNQTFLHELKESTAVSHMEKLEKMDNLKDDATLTIIFEKLTKHLV